MEDRTQIEKQACQAVFELLMLMHAHIAVFNDGRKAKVKMVRGALMQVISNWEAIVELSAGFIASKKRKENCND